MSAVLDQVDAGDDQTAVDDAAAVAAAAAKKPEAAAAAVVDDKEKTVPLAALHQEREANKTLKAQIAELEKLPRLSKEDQDALAELKAKRAEAAQPKLPEFLEDPKGYVDGQVKRAEAALKALETGQAELTQSAAQQREFQQLMGAVQQQEAAFVAETPDYFDALKHVRDVRSRQLALIYPDATKEQIAQALGQEEIAGAAQALRSKRNPAQVAYEYAKTVGYTPKAAEGDKTKVITAADKAAARTLGGSGGGGGAEVDPSETEDTQPDFTAALRERFGVKRK